VIALLAPITPHLLFADLNSLSRWSYEEGILVSVVAVNILDRGVLTDILRIEAGSLYFLTSTRAIPIGIASKLIPILRISDSFGDIHKC
jgi:hypothetical protein